MNPDELAGLSLSELLAKLEPIPEPTPISYFPETAAWLWIAAGIGCLLLGLAWLARRRWRKRAYRRAALAELRRAQGTANMASILRRTALAAYPRDEVAGLIGEEWLAFLDRTLGRSEPAPGSDAAERPPVDARFRSPIGRALLTASYRDESQVASAGPDASALRTLVERWVREHRVDATREAA